MTCALPTPIVPCPCWTQDSGKGWMESWAPLPCQFDTGGVWETTATASLGDCGLVPRAVKYQHWERSCHPVASPPVAMFTKASGHQKGRLLLCHSWWEGAASLFVIWSLCGLYVYGVRELWGQRGLNGGASAPWAM